MKLSKLFEKKANTPFISIIFILLVTGTLILNTAFNDYKLKRILLSFKNRK